MSEGSPSPRRTYSSSEEAARRAHDARTQARTSAPGGSGGRPARPADAASASSADRQRGAASRPAAGQGAKGGRPAPGAKGARPVAAATAAQGARPGRRSARSRVFGRGPLGCLGRLLMLVVLLAVVGAGVIAWAYSSMALPNPNALASSQVSIVYFDDGKTEIGRISSGANRESVTLDKVPLHVQRAFLAAEDRSFYTNKGISPSGIGRAIWVGLKGGETQGGSTITQQYVKNYFLTSDQTWKRKVKEIFLSIKLDQSKSKDEILADYLNTIYFGRGAYGIQTASKAYFDKDVSQLTPAEGAVLASIVRGPSLYDPSLSAANKKRNTDRATWILDSMVQLGWLPASQRAGMTIPSVVAKKPPSVTGGTNGYLVAAAKAELVSRAKLGDDDFERGGLKIVTSINADQQAKAVEAVERYASPGKDGYHIGFASVKPGDGGITAMYGGPDFIKQQFNDATQGAVPAGSTFKVFTLAAAVEKGINTKTSVDGNQPYRAPGTDKDINNTEGESSMGTLSLRTALAKSVNTAYARLNIAITPKATSEMAQRLGVKVPPAQQGIVGNALGVSDATPVQMAGAYAALAARGRYVAPHLVTSARTADGSVDYKADTTSKQVISQEVVADVVDAMERVVTDGTATDSVSGRGLTRPAAGKTGTGENSTSAWFDGFIPQMAAAVSMTQLDDKNARRQMSIDGAPVYGGGIPTKIWARFMVKAFGGQPIEQFPPRVGVGKIAFIGSDPTVGELSSGASGGSQDNGQQDPQGSSNYQGNSQGGSQGQTQGTQQGTQQGNQQAPSTTTGAASATPSDTGSASPSGTSSGGGATQTTSQASAAGTAGAATAAAAGPARTAAGSVRARRTHAAATPTP